MAYPPDSIPYHLRSKQPYRPSPEKDSEYLLEWVAQTLKVPQALSPLGRRYLEALERLEDPQALKFLLTWLIASGLALPPFPDQQ